MFGSCVEIFPVAARILFASAARCGGRREETFSAGVCVPCSGCSRYVFYEPTSTRRHTPYHPPPGDNGRGLAMSHPSPFICSQVHLRSGESFSGAPLSSPVFAELVLRVLKVVLPDGNVGIGCREYRFLLLLLQCLPCAPSGHFSPFHMYLVEAWK